MNSSLVSGLLKLLSQLGILHVGSTTIALGASETAAIKHKMVRAGSHIFAIVNDTGAAQVAALGNLQITDKTDGSFKIRGAGNAAAEATVHYLIINL